MKDLVILGAGTAGTMMLNKLVRALDRSEWRLTIVDKDRVHYYQPGFLFIPFGMYNEGDVTRPKEDFFPKGTNVIWDEVTRVEPEENVVHLSDGQTLNYDVLLIATGTTPDPEETPGLHGDLWYNDIFDFYTFDGATRLAKKLETWEGGRLVINLAESIIKCPVAPLEFAFLADAYFTEKGMRDRVEISYVTPLPGAFTKPKATKVLGGLLEEKGVDVISDFYLMEVDEDAKTLVSYDGQEVPFDLLVSIPVNKGAEFVEASDMGDLDDLNFIPTDKHTLKAKDHDNIFVIGDATNVPTSKAGSVAHFMGDTVLENILHHIHGEPLEPSFDGHANCFIETGFGKATLIDFNYDTEPLPGTYPLPALGPMKLLKETRLNHVGKLFFRWIYWHVLLTGRELPVTNQMSMVGKQPDAVVAN
ncbi:oxidoreductase [Longibacter salinarum]|uniref:Oxidoreductase n=1 Tax=Longibacter salinarum TaxID=1850348 RepID=A0A2A8CUS8_9BACT|nr:FAD/NAD(P)-binding oxidoreductase [Longibacter salinarum]PEN12519.1 oxidoreductase [Longibacter salinarum]